MNSLPDALLGFGTLEGTKRRLEQVEDDDIAELRSMMGKIGVKMAELLRWVTLHPNTKKEIKTNLCSLDRYLKGSGSSSIGSKQNLRRPRRRRRRRNSRA